LYCIVFRVYVQKIQCIGIQAVCIYVSNTEAYYGRDTTVKPGYKDLGYKDNLTNKDTILGPEYICMRNKDNPIPLNILLIGRSLASKHTKFSLT
jgi:hypothetical protein